MNIQPYLQWFAAFTGILGSWLLAQNKPWSRWAWPIWIISNTLWLGFAVYIQAWGVFLQNAVFLGVNMFAVRRWFSSTQTQQTS